MSLMPKLEQAYFADTKPSQEELLGFRKLFSKYANSGLSEDQLVTLAQNARSQNLDLGAELGQDYYTDKLAKQIANQRKNLGTEKYYKGDLGAIGGIDAATQYMASRLVLSGIRDINEIGEKTDKAYDIDTSADPNKAAQDFQTWYRSGGWKGQSANSVVDYNGKKYWYTNYGDGEGGSTPVLLPFGNVGEPVKMLYNKRTGEQLKQGHDVGYAYANTSISPDNPNARYTIGGTFAGNNTGLNVSMVDGIPMFYTTPGPSSSFISKESIGPVLAIASMMVPGLGVAIGSTITGALGVTVSSAVAGAIGTGVLTTIASGGDVKKGAIAAATSYFVPQIAGEIGDAANQIFESPAGKKLVENVSAAALRTAALGGDSDQIQNAVLGATAGGMFDVVTQNLPGFNEITDPKTRAAVVASVQSALDAPGDLSDKFQAAALSGATTLGLSKIDIDGKKFTDLSPGQQSIVTTALGRELAGKPLTSDDIFKTVIDAVSREVRADIQKERAAPVKKAETETQVAADNDAFFKEFGTLASDAVAPDFGPSDEFGLDNEGFLKDFRGPSTLDDFFGELEPEDDIEIPDELLKDFSSGPSLPGKPSITEPDLDIEDDITRPPGSVQPPVLDEGNVDEYDYSDTLRALLEDMDFATPQDLEDIQRGFADIGSTYTNQLNTAIKDITDKVNEYESYGATRDEAMSAAIDDMAETLGQTRQEFLDRLGETQSSLADRVAESETAFTSKLNTLQTDLVSRINAFENAGVSRETAIKNSIAELADELGDTEAGLLEKLGTTESALKSQLESGLAGVTTKFQEQVGGLRTDLLDRIKTLENAGFARDEAISSAVAELSDELGTTREDFLEQLGTTESALKGQIAAGLEGVTTKFGEQVGALKSDLMERIQAFENAGLSRDQATRASLAELADELGETEEGLLSRLGTTESQLKSEISGVETRLGEKIAGVGEDYQARLSTAVGSITDRINEFEAYGATRDEALSAAIDSVAGELGLTKDSLLAELGETESTLDARITESEQAFAQRLGTLQTNLTDRIGAFERAGLSRDDAIKQSITELADELGDTEEGLLQKLGTTEQQLQTQIGGVEERLGQQIGTLGKEYETKLSTAVGDITDRMNEFEAYGATRDEALQAAIDNVAEQLGISSQDLLDQLELNQQQLQKQIEASELEYAKQVTGLGEQVTGLGTEVSGVKTGLSELGKSVGEQVSGLGTKVTGLGTQVTGIEQALAKQPELWANLIAGLQKGFGTQIGGLQSQLTAQQKAQQAQAAQQQAAMMSPKFEAFYANIPGYKPFDVRQFSSDFYDEE
jgi:tRNA A37 threonylcarbamoyltransferase TsaD